METIEGRIEAKEEATAKTGTKYIVFTISGKKYNSFNPDFEKFKVGDLVRIGLEQKGKFKNMISMEPLVEKPGQTSQNASIGQIGATEGISKVEHDFQSEFEFGKAGNRHKIKYRTIEELKEKIKLLKEAGFLDLDDEE